MYFDTINNILLENVRYKSEKEEIDNKISNRAVTSSNLKHINEINNMNPLEWKKLVLKRFSKYDKNISNKDLLNIKKIAKQPNVEKENIEDNILKKTVDEKLGLSAKDYQLNVQERSSNSLLSKFNHEGKGEAGKINDENSKGNHYVYFLKGTVKPNSSSSFGLDGLIKINNRYYFIERKKAEFTRQTLNQFITFVDSCNYVNSEIAHSLGKKITPLIVYDPVIKPNKYNSMKLNSIVSKKNISSFITDEKYKEEYKNLEKAEKAITSNLDNLTGTAKAKEEMKLNKIKSRKEYIINISQKRYKNSEVTYNTKDIMEKIKKSLIGRKYKILNERDFFRFMRDNDVKNLGLASQDFIKNLKEKELKGLVK